MPRTATLTILNQWVHGSGTYSITNYEGFIVHLKTASRGRIPGSGPVPGSERPTEIRKSLLIASKLISGGHWIGPRFIVAYGARLASQIPVIAYCEACVYVIHISANA